MNGNTALIILNIIIIGIIAIIIVKLYYRDEGKDKEITSLADLRPSFLDRNKSEIESKTRFNERNQVKPRAPSQTRRKAPSRNRPPAHEIISQDIERSKAAAVSSGNTVRAKPQREAPKAETKKPVREVPKAVVTKPASEIKKENSVYNVNNGNNTQTVQKPASEKPVSVIKKENSVYSVDEEKILKEKEPQIIEEKTEDLKDLFTIDELIKESKRKDSEIVPKTPVTKEEEVVEEIEEPTVITPIKEETPEAETVLETEEEVTAEVIDEIDEAPIIKPLDEETETDGFSIEDIESIPDAVKSADKAKEAEDEFSDLDYRKDLKKIKNVVKSSKLLSDIKNKIAPEVDAEGANDDFRRSVGDYGNENDYLGEDFFADDWEPITPEPQPDYEFEEREYRPLSASEQIDEDLRLENTRKVFNIAKQPRSNNRAEREPSKVQITSVSFTLNNEDVTLNKNDEIIYKIDGETYSSRVLAIQGDDIIVRYRGKNKTINIDAIKKIY